MFCHHCGMQIPANTATCPHCGQDTSVSVGPAVPLLKRAMLFLEEKEWGKADDYCEQVLDLDPENAQAYIIKLMIRNQVTTEEDLANASASYADWNSYKNAVRFADDPTRERLTSYLQQTEDNIRLRQEQAQKAEEERRQQEEERQHAKIYAEASNYLQHSTTSTGLNRAIQLFRQIPNYKDSAQNITLCHRRLKEIEEKRAEQEAQETKQRRRSRLITVSIVCTVLISLIVLICILVSISSARRAEENARRAEEIRSLLPGYSFHGTNRDYDSRKSYDNDIFGSVSSIWEYEVTYTFQRSGGVVINTTTHYTKNPYRVVNGNIQWERTTHDSKTVYSYSVKVDGDEIILTLDGKEFTLTMSGNTPQYMYADGVTYQRTNS